MQEFPHYVQSEDIIDAIKSHEPEFLRLLLSAKKDGISVIKPDFDNNLAVRTAIRLKQTECIRVLMEFPGKHQHYIENKALIKACGRGDVDAVRELLKDPNINPSAFRNGALLITIKAISKDTKGTADIIRLLIEDPRFHATSAVAHCIHLAAGNADQKTRKKKMTR